MPSIRTSVESKRGCGFRKPGGKYLVSGKISRPCGLLPVPLTVCPCCGGGIKFSRTPQWITSKLWEEKECVANSEWCNTCALGKIPPNEPLLLVWIGEKFYKTTEDFMREARRQGISRRIQHVPRGFKIGETRVMLAHIKKLLPTLMMIPPK